MLTPKVRNCQTEEKLPEWSQYEGSIGGLRAVEIHRHPFGTPREGGSIH